MHLIKCITLIKLLKSLKWKDKEGENGFRCPTQDCKTSGGSKNLTPEFGRRV